MDTIFDTPFGDFRLMRYPARKGDSLQAWCAADRLLLERASETAIPPADILVVNDEHGALSLPLHGCTVWTDSALTRRAIESNVDLNPAASMPGLIWMEQRPQRDYALVLMRVPKELALFRWQLTQLRRALPAGTPLICAGMQKHLPARLEDTLAGYYGPAERQLAVGKARTFTASLDRQLETSEPDHVSWFCPELGCELAACPGVFSRDRLDIGSRFLLQQLAGMPRVELAVDLACGYGALGFGLLRGGHAGSVLFADESRLALASVRYNAARTGMDEGHRSRFLHGDGLLDYRGDTPELVLCNPPFHQGHVMDEYVGRRLVAQAGQALAAGGQLWLVANRHLSYDRVLKHYFATVRVCARNRKFTVWQAIKR